MFKERVAIIVLNLQIKNKKKDLKNVKNKLNSLEKKINHTLVKLKLKFSQTDLELFLEAFQ